MWAHIGLPTYLPTTSPPTKDGLVARTHGPGTQYERSGKLSGIRDAVPSRNLHEEFFEDGVDSTLTAHAVSSEMRTLCLKFFFTCP